jgi:hypothetical protein
MWRRKKCWSRLGSCAKLEWSAYSHPQMSRMRYTLAWHGILVARTARSAKAKTNGHYAMSSADRASCPWRPVPANGGAAELPLAFQSDGGYTERDSSACRHCRDEVPHGLLRTAAGQSGNAGGPDTSQRCCWSKRWRTHGSSRLATDWRGSETGWETTAPNAGRFLLGGGSSYARRIGWTRRNPSPGPHAAGAEKAGILLVQAIARSLEGSYTRRIHRWSFGSSSEGTCCFR